MTHALNLTLPAKQDLAAQETMELVRIFFNVPMDKWLPKEKLEGVKAILAKMGKPNDFNKSLQTRIDDEVRESQDIHFLRVLFLPEKQPFQFIQVLTEFDSTKTEYTEIFRARLPDIFSLIFGLVEGAPAGVVGMDPISADKNDTPFWLYSQHYNIHSLGTSDWDKSVGEGYLFSAYRHRKVSQILKFIDLAEGSVTKFVQQIAGKSDAEIAALAKQFALDATTKL